MNSNNIKKYRTMAKLTQGKLAEKADCSMRAIQNYERGERVPDAHIILRIAKALDTTVEALFQ